MQQAPRGVEAVVEQVGLRLLDVEIDGVRCAVGEVEVMPRIAPGRLGLVLLACHPDRKPASSSAADRRGGEGPSFDLKAQRVKKVQK